MFLLQTRGVGETVLTDLPDVVVFLFGLVTQLGDQWFFFVAFTSLYWVCWPHISERPRRTAASFVGLALGSLALVTALKVGFALPRPPTAALAAAPAWPDPLADLFVSFTTDDGFGFPSGHALGTTVVYGAAAVVLDVWDRRKRILAAAAIVGTVSLSRVVIGVHYGVDVVVGVFLGLVVLKAVFTIAAADDALGHLDPRRLFALAAALAVLALVVTFATGVPHHGENAAAALGGALGGFVGWSRLSDHESLPTLSPPVALVSFFGAGGLWVAADALDAPIPVVVLATGAVVAFILVAPQLQMRFVGDTVAQRAD
ncbi:phosphatase PAP2 family protein [Haloferax sp. MBLA0076]|uniref:Phosphatase PAP2 family protein n=1 Tax=Haloferax litoreum TaxID=2666140 RepID=A0A6A8GHB5_9EURY|nr:MULTISPECIES: phosphatase PAP2 family protein [Haloferax]KAB1192654.1 phosphatase PAP2 family protein [Haloferax sp. CBA1148]MRX21130.1 phosphatase PAP2 family protein [Haloferax litoreum]